ncbi:Protein tyrosine phosphatase type IVA 1 [Sciurus carolinensis]|uniref:protein-tyrosine-phosphatase n=1 Tax=Sciurus carolinensis TaxID=30640 RepID=A0AA41MTU2_SCICA|nr:Protein tyrosine phosphatase type IVA 1 [Sciurus carolinensis]
MLRHQRFAIHQPVHTGGGRREVTSAGGGLPPPLVCRSPGSRAVIGGRPPLPPRDDHRHPLPCSRRHRRRLYRRRLGTGCMIRPQSSMSKHIPELKKYGVTTIVRVCEATYDTTLVEKEGIHVLDWPFDDGAPPSNQIVDDWLSLVKIKFREEPGCCIAVHCVAGLGRAPVLVALALIEGGMKYEDAVQFIRQKRRGAFNSKQLLYLEKYRPKMRLRFKDSNGHRNNCCIQ